jgi:2-(3-amino-3-carboxypropyl)histidine synthase
MKILNLEARYKRKISIPRKTIDKLPASLALVTTVQYISQIKILAKTLRDMGKKVIVPDFKGAYYKGQILGCSLNELKDGFDAFFYIGEGRFHPLTLLYENNKDVYCFNPQSLKLSILGDKQREQFVKQRKAKRLKFLNSDRVGILISIKPGQYNLKPISKMKKAFPDKSFYSFIGDTLEVSSLQDFSFIDCFVNTACPRLAYDNLDDSGVTILDFSEIKELSG